MILVITGFMKDVKRYQDATGKANRKPEYVDERKYLVLHQIAPGYFQIVF
jgi:hypothetical protein